MQWSDLGPLRTACHCEEKWIQFRDQATPTSWDGFRELQRRQPPLCWPFHEWAAELIEAEILETLVMINMISMMINILTITCSGRPRNAGRGSRRREFRVCQGAVSSSDLFLFKKNHFFLDFFCHGVVLCGDLLGSRLRREEVPNRETVEQSGEKDSIFWPNWTKLSRNLLWFYMRGKGWTNFDGFSGVSAEFLLPGLASTEAASPTSLPPSPSSAAWYILRIKSSKSSWRPRQQRPNWQATCILVTVPGLAGGLHNGELYTTHALKNRHTTRSTTSGLGLTCSWFDTRSTWESDRDGSIR